MSTTTSEKPMNAQASSRLLWRWAVGVALAVVCVGILWYRLSATDETAVLIETIEHGDAEYARTLIARGVGCKACESDSNNHTEYPLNVAYRWTKLGLAEAMLDAGADPNCCDAHHATPLEETLRLYRPGAGLRAVQVLIRYGADVNRVCKEAGHSLSPLHCAVLTGDPEVVDLLLSNGARVNVRMSDGETPLHLVARKLPRDWQAVAKVLLKWGADVKAQDSEGRTPLDYAAGRGIEGLIRRELESSKEHAAR